MKTLFVGLLAATLCLQPVAHGLVNMEWETVCSDPGSLQNPGSPTWRSDGKYLSKTQCRKNLKTDWAKCQKAIGNSGCDCNCIDVLHR